METPEIPVDSEAQGHYEDARNDGDDHPEAIVYALRKVAQGASAERLGQAATALLAIEDDC